jgi:hypothetical protein
MNITTVMSKSIVRTVFPANPAKPALRRGFAGFSVVVRLKESVRSIARYNV